MGTIDQDKGRVTGGRPLLAVLASALLTAGASACGGASTGARSTSHATPIVAASRSSAVAPAVTAVDSDRDNDIGTPQDTGDNHRALAFGHAASASDRRAISALIKRYYAAALAGDGAQACSMLYSTLAESVVVDDASPPGQPSGPPYMAGAKTCQQALELLFKHFHPQLVAEVPKLRVTRISLVEHHGVALLSFGSLPERKIPIGREGRTWKMEGIYDAELP